MRKLFPVFLSLWACGAMAGGDALVIGNGRYDTLRTFLGATRVDVAAQALRAKGFDVAERRDSDLRGMHDAFRSFVYGIDDAPGPVLVILAGSFVHGPGGSYLLPLDDAKEIDNGQMLSEGFALDAVMAVLAAYPGQAMLVIGESPVDQDTGPYLSPGLGPLDIPQGVTVLRGPAKDVAEFAGTELMQSGAQIVSVARDFDLFVQGYAPANLVILPEAQGDTSADPLTFPLPPLPDPEPEPDLTADRAAWALAQRNDTAGSYGFYLRDFPDGQHAAAARQRISAIEAEPFYRERRAEETLSLTRDQRRDVQRDLTMLGYNTRGIDGLFGRGSRAAIRAWQKTNDIAESGYLDTVQIARLDAQAARRAAELEEEAKRRQEARDRADRAFWAEVYSQGDEAGLRAYLQRYPDGKHVNEARALLAEIDERRAQQAAAQDRRDWEKADAANSLAGYRAYVASWPNGAYANEARARIAGLERDAVQDRDAQKAKAEEQRLGLTLVARRLAEARLKQLGLDPGAVDGTFDRQTRGAIRKYQDTRGLRVSGYLDERTVVRLLADGVLGNQ